MNIVNFKDLNMGDYFMQPKDPDKWLWLKIKDKLYDDEGDIQFNSLIISGIGIDHDFSYETDYCPPNMKVIKVGSHEF